MARKKEDCLHFYKTLSENPALALLVEKGLLLLDGIIICGKKIPALDTDIVPGTNISCHGPKNIRCNSFCKK